MFIYTSSNLERVQQHLKKTHTEREEVLHYFKIECSSISQMPFDEMTNHNKINKNNKNEITILT